MLDKLSTPAFDEGREAFHTGVDSPFQTGTLAHRQWLEGYRFERDLEYAQTYDNS